MFDFLRAENMLKIHPGKIAVIGASSPIVQTGNRFELQVVVMECCDGAAVMSSQVLRDVELSVLVRGGG